MKRAITMALVALLWALPAAAALHSTDEIQAPRAVELALLSAEDLQAPVRSDEIQAPRQGSAKPHADDIQAPRTVEAA